MFIEHLLAREFGLHRPPNTDSTPEVEIISEGPYSFNAPKPLAPTNHVNIYSDIHLFLPRYFELRTKEDSYFFNKEMLANISPVIQRFISANPQATRYDIDVDDQTMEFFEILFSNIDRSQMQAGHSHLKSFIQKLQITRYEAEELKLRINPIKLQSFILKLPKTVCIVSNGTNYMCNPVGVNSSKIIRKLRRRNHSLMRFTFNVQPGEDFTLIQRLFNFESIEVTKSNREFLKRVGAKLQIEPLLNYFKPPIDEDGLAKYINDTQDEIDFLDGLADWLNNFDKLGPMGLCQKILGSEWIHSKSNIQELAGIIMTFINSKFQNIDLLLELVILLDQNKNETNHLSEFLPYLTQQLIYLFADSSSHCCFVYRMLQKNLISIDAIMRNEVILQYLDGKLHSDHQHEHLISLLIWFFPEIDEYFNREFEVNLDYCEPYRKKVLRDIAKMRKNVTIYKQIRDSGEPYDELLNAIYHDDVNKFQAILSQRNLGVNAPANEEINPYFYVNQEPDFQKTVIDYAAKIGSVKCFKYLYLQHAKVNENTFRLAIESGNLELVRLCYNRLAEELDPEQFDQILQVCLYICVMKYNNALFDWLVDQMENPINDPQTFASILSEMGNVHPVVTMMNKDPVIAAEIVRFMAYERPLHVLIQHGNYSVIKWLMGIHKTLTVPYDESNHAVFTRSGNLELLKLFVYNSYFNLNENFHQAIKCGYLDIVKFLIDNKFKCLDDERGYLKMYISATMSDSKDMFDYILQLRPLEQSLKYESHSKYSLLVEGSCTYGHFEYVKIFVEFLLSNNIHFDYTVSFRAAINSYSVDICYYLLEKNVNIQIEKLTPAVNLFYMDNGKLALKLIDKYQPSQDSEFVQRFIQAMIKSNNKENIEKVLEKYEPFIKALIMAIKNGNDDICLLLFEHVKNMSSFVAESKQTSVVSLTIKKYRLILINKIIDLYKGDQQELINQINYGLRLCISSIMITYAKDQILSSQDSTNILNMLSRLIQIEGVDINVVSYDTTLLNLSIQFCLFELFNFLLPLYKQPNPNVITPFAVAILYSNNVAIEAIIETFYNNNLQDHIDELNNAIKEIVIRLNKEDEQKMDNFKKQLIDVIPDTLSKFIQYKNIDFLIEVESETLLHYAFSVPSFRLINLILDYLNHSESFICGPLRPIVIAIETFNIEIVDLFIDYCGDLLPTQSSNISLGIYNVLIEEPYEDKVFIDFVTHILTLKSIHIDFDENMRDSIEYAIENDFSSFLTLILNYYPNLLKDEEEFMDSMLMLGLKLFNRRIIESLLKYYGDVINQKLEKVNEIFPYIINNITKPNQVDAATLSAIKLILEIDGINPNVYESGNTVLTHSLSKGIEDLAKLLMTYDSVDLNLVEMDLQNTPLMIAIQKKMKNVSKILINKPQVVIDVQNKNGKTALDLANSNRLSDIADLLKKRAAQ